MPNEFEENENRDDRDGPIWFENELWDVFGKDLGHEGIGAYVMLVLCTCRKRRLNLCEMAAAAQMSEQTFAEGLKIVVELGMVIVRKAATRKSPGSYDLLSLAELALEKRLPYFAEAVWQFVDHHLGSQGVAVFNALRHLSRQGIEINFAECATRACMSEIEFTHNVQRLLELKLVVLDESAGSGFRFGDVESVLNLQKS
jgi:hypothetical protein